MRTSQGIALLDDSRAIPKVRYVFDISDIREQEDSRKPTLWEMKEEYHEDITQYLESIYGKPSDSLHFPEYLMELISQESVNRTGPYDAVTWYLHLSGIFS